MALRGSVWLAWSRGGSAVARLLLCGVGGSVLSVAAVWCGVVGGLLVGGFVWWFLLPGRGGPPLRVNNSV